MKFLKSYSMFSLNESETLDKDYKRWKRNNVTIRGISEIGSENSGGARFGDGLYTAFLSNRKMAKQYGKVYFVVNNIPKNPKIFNDTNQAEIWLQRNLYKFEDEEFPNIRRFNKEGKKIESEMLKLGFDGLIIKGREMVNYTPSNILYFETENDLKLYYNYNIKLNETNVNDNIVYTKDIDSSYDEKMYDLIGGQFASYGTSVIGLFVGDKLIGGILLEEDYPIWDYRFDMVINKRYRNKGYASLLVSALIEKFKRDPVAEQISAFVINDKLMHILKRFGFTEGDLGGQRMAFLNKKDIQ